MAGVVLAVQLFPAGLPLLAGLAHATFHLSERLHQRHAVIARSGASSYEREGEHAHARSHTHGLARRHDPAHAGASAHAHPPPHAHPSAHDRGGERGPAVSHAHEGRSVSDPPARSAEPVGHADVTASTAARSAGEDEAAATFSHRHGDESEPHRHVLPVERLRSAAVEEPGEVAPPSPLDTRVDDHVPVRRSPGTDPSMIAHAPAVSPGLPDPALLPPPTPPPRG